MAAAVIAGRPPPPFELYCTPPSGCVHFLDVVHGLVDDLLGHGDAGVAAAAQALHLRDRGRAFVEAVAVLGADVAPAAGRRLGLAGELHGPREHVDQFRAAVGVFFLAEHLREEEHREAVAVGVAVVARRIADQAVGAAVADEVVDRLADVRGVLALRGGRAFAEQGECRPARSSPSDSGLGRSSVRACAVVGQPVESLADDFLRPRIV